MGRFQWAARAHWGWITSRARRAAAGLLVAGSLSRGSLAAAADEHRLEFSWTVPPSCPDRQMVLEQLEAVLHESTVEHESAAVRGDIERSGAQWVLTLDVQVGSARRVRRLAAESCDDLAKAAAVALGLLIRPLRDGAGGLPADAVAGDSGAGDSVAGDSALVVAPVDATSEPAPARPRPDAAPADELAAEPEPDVASAPLAWQLGADALVDSSTLAGAALGTSLQSHLRLGFWSLGAHGSLLPARRREVVGGSVEFEQWALGLRLCRALWAQRAATGGAATSRAWRLDGCAGAELGRFIGRGSGLNRARNEVRDTWLAASAGLHVGWHLLPHAALVGRIEFALPLRRENYVINGADPVHETPSATARASLGLEFDLL